jgi:general secretion pathway protein A
MRLAQWHDDPEPWRPDRPIDNELLLLLRQFQLAEGLDPDGVAGVRTLARLSARTDKTVPRLQNPIDGSTSPSNR